MDSIIQKQILIVYMSPGKMEEEDWCAELSLMMEAVRTSETSVDNYFTRQYIPEDNSEHHTHRSENLKSHRTDADRRSLITEVI
jgi:hypothetical protein